jgi:hypothetical protein
MGFFSISNTRLAGVLSVIALILISISDFTFTEFWDTNAMATSIVADVLVLVVGVAVVNEFITARSRRRWEIVAEYGLVELARSCRRVWVGLAEAIGVGSRADLTRDELRTIIQEHADSGRLEGLAAEAVDTAEKRKVMHEVVSELVFDARAALTSWAAVLVESTRSDSLGRFAEFQALLGRLDLVLSEEVEGHRVTTEETADPIWIAQRIATILHTGSNLAPELFYAAERIQERENRELLRSRQGRDSDGPAVAG